MKEKSNYLEAGKIVSTHGLKGDMRVVSWCDSPEQAQKMRDTVLYITRDQLELPEGTYFFEDLIGLRVVDADTDFEYGILNDIQRTGANDIYEVKKDGVSVWIPAIPQVIVKTDIENGLLLISPMEGLFDAQN